ncbi:hypothetical protein CYLTODRAFT_485390 [Cylindrobasidium torrendii FP15055 ss-10]|uniref:Uncharacterized protein n=1 Tax=Cylindrobasidium torrendii FP15055 ss-10 TaxID=1314674 RepID=A0A0D7BV93_9AGAR|nr:hypothetical protein CYLTODRAFT_485390 [Cylindrobasidium torrendii FP15055 ss-10]
MSGRAGPSSAPYGRRRQRPPKSATPSSALLSLLATVAATVPVVDGSPAPLLFLYPGYPPLDDPPPNDVKPRQEPTQSMTRRTSASTSVAIPVKFEQSDDGKWRKARTYTLYGSTVCNHCDDESAESSTPATTYASATTIATSTSTAVPALEDDLLDTLPIGWKPRAKEPKTSLIVTISLVLAFVICFLIIGCLLWRKTVRKKRRANGDVEMRAVRRRRESPEEDEEALTDRDVRRKKKIWARASARWKAHARARQRRGRRPTVNTQTSTPDDPTGVDTALRPSDDDDDDQLSYASRSPSISRSPSSESLSTNIPGGTAPVAAAEHFQDVPQRETSVPPSSPPAYHTHGAENPRASASETPSNLSPPSSSLSPSYPLGSSSSGPSEPVYMPSTAHVATDDKAMLERLVLAASSPPVAGQSHLPESSAPEWHDEELDDFADAPAESSHSELPAPPNPVSAKGKMESEYEYAFSSLHLDIEGVEPELGPSAPPFEHGPSAPPLEEEALRPSAPPAVDGDDDDGNDDENDELPHAEVSQPSAPPYGS